MSAAFFYDSNRLFCEQTDLSEIVKKIETPFYLYSKQELEYNCRQIQGAAKDLNNLMCYALKANYNPTLLQIIRDFGFGADVVSGGELFFALKAGFDPEKIVFAGVGKAAAEIEYAIKSEIHSLNIESESELHLTADIAARLQKKIQIAIRINPDIEAQTHEYISTGMHENKFGVSAEEALKLYKIAHDAVYLEPNGIHVHIGSQITKLEPFLNTIKFLKDFREKLSREKIEINYLDLGGGIGINYENNFKDAGEKSTFVADILPAYLKGFRDLNIRLIGELGRSVIGSTGLLITKVLYRKQTPLKNFLIVDAAMNNLIRPSLYNAYHEIIPLELNSVEKEVVDVVGPVCESGDFLAKDREMQETAQGAYLAVTGAGAYGQALSSNYNLRPTIPEYLVDGKNILLIGKERSVEDIANQYKW